MTNDDIEPTILIRGTHGFMQSWFALAQVANYLFAQACADEDYDPLEGLVIRGPVDFSADAASLARAIPADLMLLPLHGELGDAFARLYILGFFINTSPAYQMILPALSKKSVGDGMMRCLESGDDYVIYSECIVPHRARKNALFLRDLLATRPGTGLDIRLLQSLSNGGG
jgi:hypothetical protein